MASLTSPELSQAATDAPSQPAPATSLAGPISVVALVGYWFAFYLPVWRGSRYIGWDMLSYNLPIDQYVFEHLHGLSWPLYDPYTYNGVDFAGNIQSAMFYPPKLLLFLGLKAGGGSLTFPVYETFLLLHVLLFSILVCVVVRRFTRSWWLGLFAAVSITYSGFFQGQLEHLWYFTTLAWTPLALSQLHRAVIERRRRSFIGYAAVTLVMLLAGYPLLFLVLQMFVVVTVAVVVMIGGVPVGWRTLRDLVSAWAAVLVVAAPVVVPFLALLPHSVADLDRPNLSATALATAWLPRALGDPALEHLPGTDVTNGYYFDGLAFYLAPLALVLLALTSRRARKYAGALAASLILLSVLVFTSTLQDGLHLGILRSWTVAGCLFAVVVITVVMGGRAAVQRWSRPALVASAAATIVSAGLLLVYTTPSGYNTLAGSWRDPTRAQFSLGTPSVWDAMVASSPAYAMLSDAGGLHGKSDNWPRVVGIRSLGGFDPTAPTAYMRRLKTEAGVGDPEQPRYTSLQPTSDLAWLADNGVRYLVTATARPPRPDTRLRPLYTGHSYSVFELSGARPLLSTSGCARLTRISLHPNSLSFDAQVSQPGCQIRTTMNYAGGWHANDGLRLSEVHDGLGFMIGPLPVGPHHVVLRYRSRPLLAGCLVLLAGLLAFALMGALWLRRRGVARADEPYEAGVMPSGRRRSNLS